MAQATAHSRTEIFSAQAEEDPLHFKRVKMEPDASSKPVMHSWHNPSTIQSSPPYVFPPMATSLAASPFSLTVAPPLPTFPPLDSSLHLGFGPLTFANNGQPMQQQLVSAQPPLGFSSLGSKFRAISASACSVSNISSMTAAMMSCSGVSPARPSITLAAMSAAVSQVLALQAQQKAAASSAALADDAARESAPGLAALSSAAAAASSSRTQADSSARGKYACDQCDARFTLSSSLQRHHRTHTGEKPYVCNLCGARFSQNSSCKRHMVLHTGELPFHCKVCDKYFSQKSNLQRHLSTH